MNGPGENTGPRYRELVDPITADKRNRVIPAFGVRRRVLTLDVARVNEPLGLKGDVWYCDYNSTGTALLQLNNSSEDPFPAIALTGMGNMPFDEIFITSAAQPSLVLNLWYGYGTEFLSPTSAIATIGSITNPVKIQDTLGNAIHSQSAFTAASISTRFLWSQDGGYSFGVNFKSTASIGINTAETVFLAAANTNGGIVWHANMVWSCATQTYQALLTKATAPATATDGNAILASINPNAAQTPLLIRERAERFASGLGLFTFNGGAVDGSDYRNYDYSLF